MRPAGRSTGRTGTSTAPWCRTASSPMCTDQYSMYSTSQNSSTCTDQYSVHSTGTGWKCSTYNMVLECASKRGTCFLNDDALERDTGTANCWQERLIEFAGALALTLC
jgi:hypothetical protein